MALRARRGGSLGLEGIEAGKPVALLRDGFHEVCISCIPLGKRGIPWGGGAYFRIIPYVMWVQGVRMILRAGIPYVFYFHPWEIDAGQPRVPGLSASYQFRQRVNLHRSEQRFTALVGAFQWIPICDLIDAWSTGDDTSQRRGLDTMSPKRVGLRC